MSNGLGRFHFQAWARRGLAASLANPDPGGSLPSRGNLQIAMTVTAQGQQSTTNPLPPVTVQTYGPGDVIGIDPSHVVRTEPRAFTTNFEPNYLAGIELDEPDFPWIFTPAAPNGDRIRPWLVLIVLKDGSEYTATKVTAPLPAIDVISVAALQPLTDSWNWAHVQVSGDAGLAATFDATPGSVISRILCPRRLDPETSYTAFLVPAFEIGRLAGLGQDASATTTAPAWDGRTQPPLRLPYYYSFPFHTSDSGDFESLVRQLVPRQLGNGIGSRLMSVDQPMANFAGAGTPLGLQGALQSLVVQPTPWNDPAKTSFQTALQAFVNLTTPVTDDPANPNPTPTVVPPIYGRWHAGVATVNRTATGWLDELNLDPRNRTESGMGTQVVQGKLKQLLASAWQQFAGIELANAMLRRAQLARAAMQMMHTLRFSVASNATLLTLTAPIHARILASPQTVRATIDASRVPLRMFSSAFRRLTSPVGAIRRRQVQSGAVIGSLLDRVNSNAIAIVPPAQPPGGLVAIEDVSDGLTPSWLNGVPPVIANNLLTIASLLALALVLIAGLLLGPIIAAAIAFGIVAVALSNSSFFQSIAQSQAVSQAIRIDHLTPQTVTAVPPLPNFSISNPGVTPPPPGSGTTDSAEADALRRALTDLAPALQAPQPDPPLRAALDMQQLRDSVVSRIDPTVSIPTRVWSAIDIGALNWNPPDPIQPIMAAPSFPQPMYAPLRDLSPQYILPGVDQIQPNTVGLLEANHAFIEAYMVGLNHEMARQLLWVGFPTDLRGSYFRQFWNVSNYVPQPGDPTDPVQLAEMLKDIPPINTWPLSGPLGSHENRSGIVANNVVLIIRGELLRRYPNTIIYAAKAKIVGDQRVIDTTDERYPIFSGLLPTDITCIGFNLSPQDAKGGTAASPQGFFFVFEQHPTEPRFGLEPAASGTVQHWADLAWTNFATETITVNGPNPGQTLANKLVGPWTTWRLASQVFASVLASYAMPSFLSASQTPSSVAIVADADDPDDPANHWGVDAAQTAYIALRMPFRIAIHADLMIPT